MGPIIASGLAFLVYSIGYCFKGNCSALNRDTPWPNWVSCWVIEGAIIPSSHRGGPVAPLGPISGASNSRSGDGGSLPAANSVFPSFRALKRLISYFPLLPVSYYQRVVLKPLPFSTSLSSTLSLPNPYYIKT